MRKKNSGWRQASDDENLFFLFDRGAYSYWINNVYGAYIVDTRSVDSIEMFHLDRSGKITRAPIIFSSLIAAKMAVQKHIKSSARKPRGRR